MTTSPEPDTSSIQTVGVVGLGLLGRGIATCLLANGFDVIAYDLQESVCETARDHISRATQQLVERGHYSQDLCETWSSRYRQAREIGEFVTCDFVIESVVESLQVKESVFDQLEAVIRADVPLASNTSALPISLLQGRRCHPSRLVGMHWAEPCHLTRFLEVICGEQTTEATAKLAVELGRRAGKDPCLVQKDVPGFIVNRLGYALYREAFWLLEQGVADVDTIDRAFSNAMSVWANIAGPFRWMDLTGLQAYAAVMERLFPDLSQATVVPERMQQLVASGAQGIKNGRGFYDYSPEEAAHWEQLWTENVWRVNEMRRDLSS